MGNKEYRSHYSHIRRDVAPGRRGKRELRGRMCVRLLLHEVLMWLMLTHLLQSSLLTSKLKCLLIASSKNKKHTEEQPCTWLLHPRQEEGRGEGVTVRMATPRKAVRGKRRGVTLRMATAPEVGNT